MRADGDDEGRNTKPVRIPSLPPRTTPQPVAPEDGDAEDAADEVQRRRRH